LNKYKITGRLKARPKALLYLKEESHSGLLHHLGKVACLNGHREFESLLFRQFLNFNNMMWNQEMVDDHKKAAKFLYKIKDEVFEYIKNNPRISEFEVQEFVRKKFKNYNLKTDKWRPIISFRQNTSIIHYYATQYGAKKLQLNSLILVDIWARLNKKNAPFADITWMVYCGKKVPKNMGKVFDIIAGSRFKAIHFIKKSLKKKIMPTGREIDNAARKYVESQGYGDYFDHGTGHPLGFISDHGHGVNLNSRGVGRISKMIGYTIEPGIYLKNKFGIRSEIDFYIDDEYKMNITAPLQSKITVINPSV
jgi:Xaa-Pro aminopeptidase